MGVSEEVIESFEYLDGYEYRPSGWVNRKKKNTKNGRIEEDQTVLWARGLKLIIFRSVCLSKRFLLLVAVKPFYFF